LIRKKERKIRILHKTKIYVKNAHVRIFTAAILTYSGSRRNLMSKTIGNWLKISDSSKIVHLAIEETPSL
jgi:hypothetical protein